MMKKILVVFILFVVSNVAFSANLGTNLSLVYAFPNPYKPNSGDTTVTFTNLTSECSIKIFTIRGELVAALNETDGDGEYIWDVKNSDAQDLVSGVYLYHIKSSTDSKIGKLFIIR